MNGLKGKRSGRGLQRTIIGLLIAAFLMTFAVSSTTMVSEAKGGKWKKDSTGWWYRNSDGSYPKKTWKKIDGKWYYFLASGYMESNCYRNGYWLGRNGAMSEKNVGGKWKKDSTGWWYTDNTGWYPKNRWLTINGKQYFFNLKGYLVTNQWIDTKCVNKNGAYVEGASAAWASAYRKYMKKNYLKEAVNIYNCDHLSFDLVYVDDDNTPELLVRSEEYGNRVDIISYYKGKLYTFLDLGFDGTVYLKDHTGLIYDISGRMGIYHKYISKLSKGKLDTLGVGLKEANDDLGTSYTYTWNNQEVTEEEYESLPEEIYKVRKGEDVAYFTYYSYSELDTLLATYK